MSNGGASFAEPTFGQRLLGRAVDALVLLPALALTSAAADGRVRSAIGLVVAATYEVGFVTRYGRTPGKMAMGTLITDHATGAGPTARQAILRWLTMIAGPIVAVIVGVDLGSIWVLIVVAPVMRPPLHRGLHDLVAGTIVMAERSPMPR